MDDVFAGLEGLFDDIDAEEIVDVSTMKSQALLDLYNDLTQELLEMKQSLKPRTQEARDKHSLRNAAQIELRSRKIPV